MKYRTLNFIFVLSFALYLFRIHYYKQRVRPTNSLLSKYQLLLLQTVCGFSLDDLEVSMSDLRELEDDFILKFGMQSLSSVNSRKRRSEDESECTVIIKPLHRTSDYHFRDLVVCMHSYFLKVNKFRVKTVEIKFFAVIIFSTVRFLGFVPTKFN